MPPVFNDLIKNISPTRDSRHRSPRGRKREREGGREGGREGERERERCRSRGISAAP